MRKISKIIIASVLSVVIICVITVTAVLYKKPLDTVDDLCEEVASWKPRVYYDDLGVYYPDKNGQWQYKIGKLSAESEAQLQENFEILKEKLLQYLEGKEIPETKEKMLEFGKQDGISDLTEEDAVEEMLWLILCAQYPEYYILPSEISEKEVGKKYEEALNGIYKHRKLNEFQKEAFKTYFKGIQILEMDML